MTKTIKKVAIVQSNYIPWKGYFDLINMVDEFILFDDMQYTRRDWRNRNYIKTQNGLQWLTIPVDIKGKYFQKINETRISDPVWSQKHWASIIHNYSRSRYFKEYSKILKPLYLKYKEEFLSQVNYRFLNAVCDILGIKTKITWSMDYKLAEGRVERLIGLCKSVNAGHYISGPSAKEYINEELLKKEGIKLSYIDYSGYPEYTQLFGEFKHEVSIIDLIFNEGPNATKYMKSF